MKTRLILIITLLLVLALALAGGFTLLWRFFIFLAAVLLPSYLWPRLSLRGIEGRAEKTSEVCQVSEGFEEEFTLVNRRKLPTPLVEVREDTDLPGYENAAAFNLAGQASHRWRTGITCRRRGRYSLGALTVRVSDPLGFFPVTRQLGARQDIIVYPATLDLPFFQALPRQEMGANRRRWLASQAGPGAARVREYASGDSLRHIHWHSTAHTGELMVKEFDPDRSNYAFKDIWIVLDMHRDSQLGEGDDATGEYSITVAASLAKKYLDSGKQVGLIAAGDRPYLFPPDTGEAHLEALLRALALMQATGNKPIEALLASEVDRFDAGSAVIVVLPSRGQGITVPLRRAINRGTVVTAILLDSRSFGGETGTATAARSLVAGGINVYIVHRGARIADALDSRRLPVHMHFRGDKT